MIKNWYQISSTANFSDRWNATFILIMKAKTRFFKFILSCIFSFRNKGHIEQALPLLYNCERLNILVFFVRQQDVSGVTLMRHKTTRDLKAPGRSTPGADSCPHVVHCISIGHGSWQSWDGREGNLPWDYETNSHPSPLGRTVPSEAD